MLIRVEDSYNLSLSFTYNTAGRIATITDNAGTVIRYGYDSNNNLTTVTYPDETPAISTDNPKKTYVYNESVNTAGVNQIHALTGIIDENNVRYATYKYNTQGKAISTEHAGSVNKFSLAYNNDGSTTITDPLGSVRSNFAKAILNVVKSTGQTQPAGIGCGPSARNIAYDANGNITRLTDFNGNTTCYAYDTTRNLETVRVEGLAAGSACLTNLASYLPATGTSERKISTEWHPTWRLRTRVAEPKRITAWDYGETLDECGAIGVVCSRSDYASTDETGAQGLTAPTNRTRQWRYQYNPRGQLLVSDGPRDNASDQNDQTAYAYYADDATEVNNRKRLYTVTDSQGHVTTYTHYDANGRPLESIAANGVVTAYTYTPRGQLKTVSHAGLATQMDYYANGLLKQVTTPTVAGWVFGIISR
ncbi:RHS repeat protein [Methylocucumis oryzae]|uniref:Uncharacterized protein n=1 Tax=Methylocucumis oryzae TaxID=1632867 RepID=A0A0F3IJY8_9GAMM|nr:RHS repeat protein [Methylocucumis oryzae]KJV06992.1 hypothetical protein VZ94_07770 [Methylocucumis oryzae]